MRFDFLTNLVFPPVCVACRRQIQHGVLCEACFAGIAVRKNLLCGDCHAQLAAKAIVTTAASGGWQSPCHPDFPYLLGASTDYDDPTIQSLIHHLKFRSIPDAAGPLAELIIRYCQQADIRRILDIGSIAVVPIPLSVQRLRRRGYNQTELIARRVAQALDLPMITDTLVRVKHAKPQSETKDLVKRKENIIGAYAVRNIPAANIILIDDVSTSGATFLEAARTLKSAGSANILALAAAKT